MLEHRGIPPKLGKRCIAHVADRILHVRTRRYFAHGSDPGIARASQTATGLVPVRRGHRPRLIEFQGHALEMRRTLGAHDQAAFVARGLGDLGQNLLVGLHGDIGDFLATPGTNKEEHIEHEGAGFPGEGDHIVEFMGVVIGHRKMNLETQLVVTASVDASHGFFPRARLAAKVVMIGGIQRIDADADALNTGIFQGFCPRVVEQGSVGADDDHQTAIACMLCKIG